MYDLKHIAGIIGASGPNLQEQTISELLTDSRRLQFPEQTLFFSLPGSDRSGDQFITDLISKGVHAFVVQHDCGIVFPDHCSVLKVDDVLKAFQHIVIEHRKQFTYPVIGITGSNGKTIVKEMLFQLLKDERIIVRSPKSYNSQVGVPLSVWAMQSQYDLGIFEAGISSPGEMEMLEKIIQPTIGVYTYNGSAHASGFISQENKINEKLLLFTHAQSLIYYIDDSVLHKSVEHFRATVNPALELFSWGRHSEADLQIQSVHTFDGYTDITCNFNNRAFNISIPFVDEASIHNCMTCSAVLLKIGIPVESLSAKMQDLKPVEMRLQLKSGINNTTLINDSYSADIDSLRIALEFLKQQSKHSKRTVILSDLLQTNIDSATLYQRISNMLEITGITKFIGIGDQISASAHLFKKIPDSFFFASTEEFVLKFNSVSFHNEAILIKGARVFHLEQISRLLEAQQHSTVLEINLDAIRHNLQYYRSLLLPGVQLMVMVKASAYGSGSYEIANLLQHYGVAYLAVAYADEGYTLRKSGITLPIMVLNVEESDFSNLVKYTLEPEIFSLAQLSALVDYCLRNDRQRISIHLKLDTGMHRLGFGIGDIPALINLLKSNPFLEVRSVFTHLSASDDEQHDSFSLKQYSSFTEMANVLQENLPTPFLRHIANTSAISRFPQFQMNMVRLGIGAYGIDSATSVQNQLQNVSSLKTTISQVKLVKQGESIGYGRNFILDKDSTIAIVRIGYADGYRRDFGNGRAVMFVNGCYAPTIGNVCMDMTMLDVTGIPCVAGMEVIVFGKEVPVKDLAKAADTIPYEILTSISQRVPRIYYHE